jgi:hypothetical protein
MVIRYFNSWLKKNNHRFKYPLQVVEKSGPGDEYSYIKLKYKGIISDIYVKVMDNCIQVQVNYRESRFDTICDFEIEVEKLNPGEYGCTLCKEYDKERFQTYKTARELLAAHVYEDLLDWSNRYISTANFLLYQGDEGFSAAWVKPQDEIINMLNKDEEEYIIQILSLREYKNPMDSF